MGWSKENIINLTFFTIYQEDLIHALGLTLLTPGLVATALSYDQD